MAADSTPFPIFSPDTHLGLEAGVITDESSAFQNGAGYSLINLGDLPVAADVDGLHGLDGGQVLFSLESSAQLGDALYRPNDVILVDATGWSKALDGSAAGIPDGVNIDAVAMTGDVLLISVDVGCQLDGLLVDDSDVIAYDQNAFSLYFDASAAGIDPAADVDAIHIDEQGRLHLSFDTGGDLGGIRFDDEDVLIVDSPNWLLEFDGSAEAPAWQAADLDAWSVV